MPSPSTVVTGFFADRHRRDFAGLLGLAADEHGAGAALGVAAAEPRAFEAQIVAQAHKEAAYPRNRGRSRASFPLTVSVIVVAMGRKDALTGRVGQFLSARTCATTSTIRSLPRRGPHAGQADLPDLRHQPMPAASSSPPPSCVQPSSREIKKTYPGWDETGFICRRDLNEFRSRYIHNIAGRGEGRARSPRIRGLRKPQAARNRRQQRR